MAVKNRMPGLKPEQEQAAWWDAHPEVLTKLLLKARKEGKNKRIRLIPEAKYRAIGLVCGGNQGAYHEAFLAVGQVFECKL